MYAVIKKGDSVRVLAGVDTFAYRDEQNDIMIEFIGRVEMLTFDCRLYSVYIKESLGSYDEYTFLSDEDKKREGFYLPMPADYEESMKIIHALNLGEKLLCTMVRNLCRSS